MKSIPSTEHHKNGYWWRRRGVWVAASAFLKKDTLRPAYHLYVVYIIKYKLIFYIIYSRDFIRENIIFKTIMIFNKKAY